MGEVNMKNFWLEPEQKKVNKKKLIISIIIAIFLVIFTTVTILYVNNKQVRNWIDKNILQKEKTQNNLPSIEIEESDNSSIYAFNKYLSLIYFVYVFKLYTFFKIK